MGDALLVSQILSTFWDTPFLLFFPFHFVSCTGYFLSFICSDACMRTIVFIALRHIEHGEEVVMDYRLNPNHPELPEWYSSYNESAAKERWESLPAPDINRLMAK